MSAYQVIRADMQVHREQIEGLWARNLSLPGDPHAKFRWQFLENPYGQGCCWLVQADGEPVGAITVGARQIHSEGKVFTVGVTGDFVIDRRHRIAQPALMLQRAVISSLGDGQRLVYGFPNPLALPLMKRAGYQEAAPVHRHAKPVDIASYLARHPRTRILPSWVASTADLLSNTWQWSARRLTGSSGSTCLIGEFDGRFDELWDRVRRQSCAMGVRDSRFLKWRFTACPLRSYQTLGLLARGGRRLDGYLVFYIESNAMICADLVVASGGADLRALIFDAAQYARRARLSSMSLACVLTPELMAGLKSCQFRRRTVEPQQRGADPKLRARTLLVHKLPGDTLLDNGWYITGGDEDND
jgi:hypothetical protein